MSTDKRTERRKRTAGTDRAGADRRSSGRTGDGNRTGGSRAGSGNRTGSRAGGGNRSGGSRAGGGNRTGGNRQRTGRGMTRQQRQKQLLTHVLIAAAVIIAAVVVIASLVRAGSRRNQTAEASVSTEISQAAVTADNTEAAQTTAESTDAASAQQTEEAAAPAPIQGTVTAGTSNTAASQTGADAAGEAEEEVSSGPSMADQSLVEKLSVEAKKNLEEEKIRLAKEEEERQRLAEEEAKKAEVKDRDELSQISIEELVEYLRNKEVPEELIGFMEEYPEAREFVTDYLYQPDPPLSKDISGEVQKGVFPHFLQWDERWGYEDYGGSFFAVAGCGPTAMSVVYSGLTGNSDMNPYKMGQWAEEQGYYIVGEGTSWEMMWSGANSLGLYWWEVDFDELSVATALQNGYPIIAAMSPGGDFTSFGHFIVMTGIDDEGNITIRDSNSIERTERTWTWDELMWQTAAMWAYSYDDGTYY